MLAPLAHQHASEAGDAPGAAAGCPACVAPLGQGQLVVETSAPLPARQPKAMPSQLRDAVPVPSAGALAAQPVRGPPSLA